MNLMKALTRGYCNHGVAAVGINIPFLIPIESASPFVKGLQSIGRGVPKAKDKDFVQIWDPTYLSLQNDI